MTVRIFRPAKTAMQSGWAKTHDWVVEFEPADAKRADPLMGWAGSRDTQSQLRMSFPTEEEAIAYCRKNGLEFSLAQPHDRTIRPKAYADNFRYDRIK